MVNVLPLEVEETPVAPQVTVPAVVGVTLAVITMLLVGDLHNSIFPSFNVAPVADKDILGALFFIVTASELVFGQVPEGNSTFHFKLTLSPEGTFIKD